MVCLTDGQVHYAVATIIANTMVKMGWRSIRPAWREVGLVCIACIFYMLVHEGYKVLQYEMMTIKEEIFSREENLVSIRDQLVAKERTNLKVSLSKRKMVHLPMLRCIIASPSSTLQMQ